MPEKSFSTMRDLVALVAGPRSWNDNRKSWLSRAAKRAGISYRQVHALFYGEITDPLHRSARLLQDAAEELAQRYETIATGMGEVDAHLYRKDCAALIDRARALRDLARARNDPKG